MSSIPDYILLRSMVAAWDDEQLVILALHAGVPTAGTRAEVIASLTEEPDVCRSILDRMGAFEEGSGDEEPPEGFITRREMIGMRLVENSDVDDNDQP